MKTTYDIQYQQDGNQEVITVFDSTQNWRPQVGAEYELGKDINFAKNEVKRVKAAGGRLTGDLTHEIARM